MQECNINKSARFKGKWTEPKLRQDENIRHTKTYYDKFGRHGQGKIKSELCISQRKQASRGHWENNSKQNIIQFFVTKPELRKEGNAILKVIIRSDGDDASASKRV